MSALTVLDHRETFEVSQSVVGTVAVPVVDVTASRYDPEGPLPDCAMELLTAA
jgi:hypothetical protein